MGLIYVNRCNACVEGEVRVIDISKWDGVQTPPQYIKAPTFTDDNGVVHIASPGSECLAISRKGSLSVGCVKHGAFWWATGSAITPDDWGESERVEFIYKQVEPGVFSLIYAPENDG